MLDECGWIRAIDEELINTHLGVAGMGDSYSTAKGKLDELIEWHVQVALDPAVNGGDVLVSRELINQVFECLKQFNIIEHAQDRKLIQATQKKMNAFMKATFNTKERIGLF